EKNAFRFWLAGTAPPSPLCAASSCPCQPACILAFGPLFWLYQLCASLNPSLRYCCCGSHGLDSVVLELLPRPLSALLALLMSPIMLPPTYATNCRGHETHKDLERSNPL